MKSLAELTALRDKMKAQIDGRSTASGNDIIIRVGMATCGIAAGARPVLTALMEEIEKRKLQNVRVVQTGCIGMCRLEPIVEVIKNGEKTTYIRMTADKAKQVVAEHIVNGNICKEFVVGAQD